MERHGIHREEVSDDEEESTKEVEHQVNANPVRLFKSILAMRFRPQLKDLTYDENLNAEESIHSINKFQKYFNYE